MINNQVGFTTSPAFARSSPYPSDIAKSVQAPILHVNGDDPEAVTFACKLAIEYRQKFKRDIVIDMWCYRRFGHNEGDEPSFTQPLMYSEIRKHPPISDIYGARLVREGVVDRAWIDADIAQFTLLLEGEFEAARTYLPNKADWFEGRWAGLGRPGTPETERRNVGTAVDEGILKDVGGTLTTIPADLDVHKTLARIVDAKRQMFESGEGFDWATAEAIAFGTLVREGFGASACRARTAAAARSASATRSGSIRRRRANISRSPISRAGASRCAILRSASSACSATNMAIRSPIRAPWCCGKPSSAISSTERR